MDDLRVLLTPQERSILWSASQGLRSEAIARQHGMDDGSIRNIYVRISQRLGTLNLIHSVAYALTNGIIGPYRDCGERRSYLRHLRRKETPCVACRAANARYVGVQTSAPRPGDIGITPTQVRILKHLSEHDCSQSETAGALGMQRQRVASHMTEVYQRLGVAHLHRADRRYAAIKIARDRGYLG